ncbi:MetQ/NlpA family ABC transporter substrate-binding protein [Enterococcus sp. HY326]|uniref:MetQ/NlpA family ABC transporter substrate-binding protein n=1 Tax=Enterococcus sp. HY326 TaxID=2971265 RepID=UPI0022404B5F|nr:MetQ/NlpA family ABC transporter substrate-binding protein [Enterococcus sp. HY326]
MKKLVAGLFIGLAGLTLAACSTSSASPSESSSDEAVTVKLGVVGDNTDVWDSVSERLADEGINIEYVKFTDYTQPNVALSDGSIDLNSFQTEIFLDAYNEESGDDLTPIGLTVIAPLGIYSDKVTDVKDLTEGATIAIPNDTTNGGRALLLLETAGLIEVDDAAGSTPTPSDITDNPLNLNIEEVDASQTARSLQDVDASVINSGMAVDAGFTPSEDAIFLEPVSDTSRPYVNVIVARSEDVDNETYKKIVAAYQTEATEKVIDDTSKGSSIAAWNDFEL